MSTLIHIASPVSQAHQEPSDIESHMNAAIETQTKLAVASLHRFVGKADKGLLDDDELLYLVSCRDACASPMWRRRSLTRLTTRLLAR